MINMKWADRYNYQGGRPPARCRLVYIHACAKQRILCARNEADTNGAPSVRTTATLGNQGECRLNESFFPVARYNCHTYSIILQKKLS